MTCVGLAVQDTFSNFGSCGANSLMLGLRNALAAILIGLRNAIGVAQWDASGFALPLAPCLNRLLGIIKLLLQPLRHLRWLSHLSPGA